MNPALVGAIRAAILAGATVAIDGIITAVSGHSLGSLAPYQPVILGGLRVVEGFVDKLRGQAPQKALGSAPADPNVYNLGA